MPKTITKDQVENTWKIAAAKVSDLNNQINMALNDSSVSAEEMQKLKDERDKSVEVRDTAQEQLAQFTGNTSELPKTNLKTQPTKDKIDKQEIRNQINNFVHGAYKNANSEDATGITSPTVSPTIPEQIIYNPANEINSVVDLSQYVTKTPVSTASGTSPILARANYVLPTVEELKENPSLAIPEFTDVKWEVKTHRGALAISNESMQDSAVDVSGLVLRQMGEAKVNTYNASITSILKDFSTADANNDNLVDAFKYLLNVGLDPAYHPMIIASQSMYNALDTLKDKNGQYIFHRDVTGKSGSTLLGTMVVRVGDTLLGKAGEAKAFIGDLSRSLFFADRQNINLSWQYNQIFGNYLAAALRYDVVKADAKAGYFLSATLPENTIVKPDITLSDDATDENGSN